MRLNTGDVAIQRPRLRELQSHKNCLNATDTLGWLYNQRDIVGWTYSINLRVWTLIHPSRLIVDRLDFAVNKKIRVATCCHIKCYIAQREMLIGSFNLTAPTIEDLSYRVTDMDAIRHMKKQFELAWHALK